MTITYTWNCEVDKTQPYNINSSQANIVEQINWTFIGDNGKTQRIIGGATKFDVTQGVDGSFVPIDTITKATLEGWIKATLGDAKINEMKEELKTILDNIDESIDIAPE